MINNIKKIEKLPLIRTEAVLIIGALHDAIKHDEKLDWYRTQQNELNTMRDLIDEIIELFPSPNILIHKGVWWRETRRYSKI